jgi:hypothetical protein
MVLDAPQTSMECQAIDIQEGDKVDQAALKDLIRAQSRSISRTRASRSPGERAANGPTSFIAGPGHISSHGRRASARSVGNNIFVDFTLGLLPYARKHAIHEQT